MKSTHLIRAFFIAHPKTKPQHIVMALSKLPPGTIYCQHTQTNPQHVDGITSVFQSQPLLANELYWYIQQPTHNNYKEIPSVLNNIYAVDTYALELTSSETASYSVCSYESTVIQDHEILAIHYWSSARNNP